MHRRKNKKKSKVPKALIKIIMVVILITVVYKATSTAYNWAKNTVSNNTTTELSGETVTITIPLGASTSEIAEILKQNGLIKSTVLFRLSSKFGGYDGKYIQGTYVIDKALDDEEIMVLLQSGTNQINQLKITIPEGYTTVQIGTYLEDLGVCTAQEFIDEANYGEFKYGFLKDIPQRNNYLEGYLFPDTYFITNTTTPHQIITKMLDRFEEIYESDIEDYLIGNSYSLDEIITIASIIEKEIQISEERAIASGVIYNRLRENMPLQMCSTVLYSLGKHKTNLTIEDTQTESPYNTYINTGLPIGPIANPGKDSIIAALNPEYHNYMYFVLKGAEGGSHVFCETYDEFILAKEKYKQSF